MKRSLSIFLCIAMLLGMTPVQAYASAGESAANAPKEEWTQTSVKVAPDPGLPENDELYDGYVQQLFYGKEIAVFGTAAGERLIGDEKLLYDALVPLIRQLASGQRTSSILCIGQEVEYNGTVYPVDADVVFAEPMISDASLGRVVDALLADLPYEMYWYDKVDGCEAAIIHGSTMLQICLRFTVADNYRGADDYSVDTTKAKTATTAAANAQKLIDTYASASDYEKLVSYKDEICDLVSYDHAAADDGHFSTDNDPWQLIYVFDGDDSTNVVCEGYSKAFMYLCDMTAFSGDVSCYTVMGTMDDGNHMWNVVSIGGGNYLADVTNSDAGTVGQDGSFFLTGASGSAAEGYVVDGHTYRYDEDTRNLWGTDAESILTLKNTPYDPSAESTEIASGTCGKNLTWTLGSDGVLVISGTGKMNDYYSGETAPWNSRGSEITEVIVESGVTSIGRWAFYECRSLTNIVIPDSVTSIGTVAFYGCSSLTSIELPNTITSIGDATFFGCSSLTSIIIPDSITSIGECAFKNCSSLTSIELPDNLTNIDEEAFYGCKSLTSIVIPDGVTSIGRWAFYECRSLTNIVIPDSVTSIGSNAFSDCINLTSIELPDSVTSIGNYAFFRCSNLTSIVIPDSVTSIGNNAFSRCSSLTSIVIPDSVTSIGDSAFVYCINLTSIKLPDTITSIGEYAFCECSSLTSIVIPDSVTSIGNDAFSGCSNLTSIVIPDSVTSIGSWTFYECRSLTNIELPDSVTSIGNDAFSGCSNLTSIVIPDSVTSIGSSAFSRCSSLTSIVIPDSVTSIGDSAFVYCINLTSIELPDSVTSIGNSAFYGCSSLTSIVIPDSVTSIGSWTFYECRSLTNIELPDSVTSIGNDAFSGCSNLTSIVIPDSVTSIGSSAFSRCSSLTSIVIPDSVTSIGDSAFVYCINLTSIELPDSVTSIGNSAFYGCSSLTSIVIPDSVTSIGSWTFYECRSLTNIELPDNLTSIGADAFSNCHRLTSIEFPDNLTSIGARAFLDCGSLTSITFKGDAPNIASDAFSALDATCYYPGNNETWTEAVMQNYGGTITWLVIGSTQGPGSGSGSGEEPGEGSGTGSGEGSGEGSGSGTGGGGSGSGEEPGEGSGESSDDVGEITWTFADGVLTISGTGKMPDYTNNNEPPWDDVMDEIISLVIEPGVTSIGIYAFSSASIVEIDLPSSITYIAPGAFAGCDKLASITVAKGNQKYTVVDGVLFNRNMTTLVLYPSASTAKTYTIPNTVTALSGYAFSKARNLKQINIPNTVQKLGFDTFHGCTNLTEVIIPDGVTEIGRAVFDGCTSLKYVSIPNSVGTIGLCAFYNCESLSSLQIPDIVTTIGNQAFYGCSSLVELTIPDSVVSIGDLAFGGCKSLVSVYLGQGVTSMEEMPFDSQYLKDIQVAKGNQYFASVDGVLFNKDKTELLCYPGGREVQSYTIPNTVTDIGSYAFFCCMNLTSMVIPDGVTSIGSYAFASCINLTDIQIPNSVTSIGQAAFAYCINLTSIELPDDITSIGVEVFYDCRNLTRIVIPDGVTSISSNAFADCSSLTSIELPGSLTVIDTGAFSGCSSLTSIEIPDGVTSINSGAFFCCSSLNQIFFRGNAPAISSGAFFNIRVTAYYPPDDATWTSDKRVGYGGSITWVPFRVKLDTPKVSASNNASTGKIKLTWEAVDGATQYKVYRATSKTGKYKLMKTTTGTSYTNTSSQVGEKFYYYVVAETPYELKSAPSSIVSRTCDLPRPVVTASNVASSGKIKLTWDAIDGAVEYKVYRATSKTGQYSIMKTTTGTSYTNTSAETGNAYYYKVIAVHADSTANSAYSEVKSRTCDLPRPVVTASNVASSGKIKLTWDAIDGAVEYKVYRAASKSGEYKLMKTTTDTSYTNTSAEAGNAYYYKVIAVHSNSSANSAYSEVKSRTCDLPQPVVTTENVASSGKIKLTWKAIDGAVEYKVYRAASKSGEYKLMKTTTDTSYTNTSAEAGNAYYYKIIAVHSNSAANSAYSEVKSRTCDLARPVVSVSLNSSGKPVVNWKAVSGAAKYTVYIYNAKGDVVKTTSTTSTKLTHSSATKGTTYTYKVVAVHSNTNANSAKSTSVSIKSK